MTHVFDDFWHQANVWIKELSEDLGWQDHDRRSLRLLRITMHALRDRVPMTEALQFAAQLPTILRGIYFERYRPTQTPTDEKTAEEFVEKIEREMNDTALDQPENQIRIVLTFLNRKITEGEMADIRGAMPKDMERLFA
ncbi:MAG: DUF2267 domain-containing protein [Rhodothalassiaceae bacterium]